jgi:GNAT superfamily N-acetyltransferase
MSLHIRPAQESDCEQIARFVHALAEYERLAHECVADAESVRVQLFCDQPKAEALIAEWEGEPVGFALYFTNFSTFLMKPGMHLEDVFVYPDHRGKGIGKAFFKVLAEICVERGYGRFEWSVLDWNEPSIKFYESLGATAMRDWFNFRLSGESLQKIADL